MPDNKTVYATDDGTNTAFWKFVADKPGDMSSGTLYGAKFFQTSDINYGDFEIGTAHGVCMAMRTTTQIGLSWAKPTRPS